MTFPTTQDENTTNQENFQEFYKQWTAAQEHQLRELISVSRSPDEPDNTFLGSLVNRAISHYEEYYKVKSRLAKDNVFVMLSPTWTTVLEDGFLWIGGWRPSMAFQLLYSKSGLQLEAQLSALAQGIQTGDLADLGSSQLVRIDQLQRKTIKEEREITEKMAKQQDTVADSEMVELSGVVSELMETDENSDPGLNDRVDSVLGRKEEGLLRVLGMADDLRLRTLKGVVEILSPKQAVHFLIAGAELHLRMHEWGKKVDEKKHMG